MAFLTSGAAHRCARSGGSFLALMLVAVAPLVVLGGCKADGYELIGGGDNGTDGDAGTGSDGDGGTGDGDGGSGNDDGGTGDFDAGPTCTDGVDDDCDGSVDCNDED